MQTHPYSIAVSLGKQIRFSAPLDQITAELEAVAPKYLAQERRQPGNLTNGAIAAFRTVRG